MNLKIIEKVFMSKFIGPGPSSYKKRIYRAAVSQRLRNTVLDQYFPTTVPQNFVSARNHAISNGFQCNT
jgi:hypothetical protein